MLAGEKVEEDAARQVLAAQKLIELAGSFQNAMPILDAAYIAAEHAPVVSCNPASLPSQGKHQPATQPFWRENMTKEQKPKNKNPETIEGAWLGCANRE